MKKILVADDSVTIQKIVAMAFEKEDAIVEGISNGKDAFDKMKSFQPNIILADIDMPGLTGFELSKKIKGDPKFNSTKVLLLASDFEDFNQSLFKDSCADAHISKPFKSEDIIKKVADLLSKGTPTATGEAITLTTMDMDETIGSSEAAVELSLENLVEEVDSAVELSAADLEEIIEPTTTDSAEEDPLDEMIKDVEALKDTTDSANSYSDYDELSEAAPTEEDEIGDELDTAFQEIVKFGLGKELDDSPNIEPEPTCEASPEDSILPEPEDLLEKMAPSSLGQKKRTSGPNLIQESLSYLSQIAYRSKSRQAIASYRGGGLKGSTQLSDTDDDRIVGEHVRQILENSLNTTIEKEIAGLSNSITQSVREVVREITPKIAREIIKEEIDKIKKS